MPRTAGPYKVQNIKLVGGDGGFDYVTMQTPTAATSTLLVPAPQATLLSSISIL